MILEIDPGSPIAVEPTRAGTAEITLDYADGQKITLVLVRKDALRLCDEIEAEVAD